MKLAIRHPSNDTVPNLATYHAPPAAHLRQSKRDSAPLRFDDVTPELAAPVRPVRRTLRPNAGRMVLGFLAAADPNTAMHREFGHHIPPSVGLRKVPLPRTDGEESAANAMLGIHVAAILAHVATHPQLADHPALLMALAPIAAMLAEVSR